MVHTKGKKGPANATLASISKEMAKPRMARSAKIAELNFDTARISEQQSVTMSIKSSGLPARPTLKRHRLLWTERTTGIEISGLKMR